MHPSTQPTWKKSSLCASNSCVEVAELPNGYVGVRNSAHPNGMILAFTRDEWTVFLAGAKLGDFDA